MSICEQSSVTTFNPMFPKNHPTFRVYYLYYIQQLYHFRLFTDMTVTSVSKCKLTDITLYTRQQDCKVLPN